MGRKKPDRDIVNINELEIENKIEIDYDKLAKAIVKANAEAEHKKKEERERKEAEDEKRIKEILGEKDFSHIKRKTVREFRRAYNSFKVMLRILTLSREKAEYFDALFPLIGMLTSFLLFVIGLAFYALAGIALYVSFQYGLFAFTYGIMFALLFIMFARIIRIARFEIERIEDASHLMNISMTIISVVTLVLAVIGLFAGANSSNNVGGG